MYIYTYIYYIYIYIHIYMGIYSFVIYLKRINSLVYTCSSARTCRLLLFT